MREKLLRPRPGSLTCSVGDVIRSGVEGSPVKPCVKKILPLREKMEKDNLLQSLTKYVLPTEIVEYFELVEIKESGGTLDLYLDESNIVPVEYETLNLSPNGFYEESAIKDFPLRDRKVVLHVRRRRWIDSQVKSYSRNWELTAAGTRYSKEFAFF
jgi:hypothetical protein